jgi:hypothetical protein
MADEPYIEKYLRYTAGQESPHVFHFWAAVSTIAYAVGRSVWIDQDYFKIYPNHYIILVAGSGACKKGAAVGVARGLIGDALGNRDDRLFIPGKIYPEALIRAMNKRVEDPFNKSEVVRKVHRAVLLFSPELGSFLSKAMQQSGMPDLLTELYDCPDVHDHVTKNSGVDKLQDVCLNLLGATTPTWMQRNMTPAIFGEGFSSRALLIYARKPKGKFPRPRMTEEQHMLRAELVLDLDRISKFQGEFLLSDEAGDFYDNWYMTRSEDEGIVMDSGFYQREPDHVLKLSMTFSLSAGVEPYIYPAHIKAAIKMLQQVRGTMKYALAGAHVELGQKPMYRVLSTIEKNTSGNGVTLKDLGNILFDYLDPETIQRCVVGLRQNGQIESHLPDPNNPVTHYRALTGETHEQQEVPLDDTPFTPDINVGTREDTNSTD